MKKLKTTIGIVGVGHIGQALLQGFIRNGIRPDSFIVRGSSPAATYASIRHFVKLGLETCANNTYVAQNSKIIFLAVKPKLIQESIREAQLHVPNALHGKTVVSLAAGVPYKDIKKWAGLKANVVRIMPNIPIASGKGVIGMYAPQLSKKEKLKLDHLLSNIGKVIEVKTEQELDALTIISGCGPAIVSYFITILAKSGRSLGLKEIDARYAAKETFVGTLNHLELSRISPEELEQSVATKGGITEMILMNLKKGAFEKSFRRALGSASKRLRVRR